MRSMAELYIKIKFVIIRETKFFRFRGAAQHTPFQIRRKENMRGFACKDAFFRGFGEGS